MARALTERFWENVSPEPNTGCFLWAGGCDRPTFKTSVGYGRLDVLGKKRGAKAHRVAWELAYGAVPPGMFVLHRCDVTCCVNPDHLFLGTHADNMADMVQKGRTNWRPAATWHRTKSHCPHGHAYSPDNIVWSAGRRNCRVCHNARSRIAKARIRMQRKKISQEGAA